MFGDEKVMEAMRWLIRREYEDRRVAEYQADEARRQSNRLEQRCGMYESFLRDRGIGREEVEEAWTKKGYGVP